VDSTGIIALREEGGNTYIVRMEDAHIKVKGIGVFNPKRSLEGTAFGDDVDIGSKTFTILPASLPERVIGMRRRAQIIQPKDAGALIARMGIGAGSRVLEAGMGSGGLSMQIQNVLGEHGVHVVVEARSEHAEVGLENLERGLLAGVARSHHHIEGRIEQSIDEISAICSQFDAMILDLADHPSAISAVSGLLGVGGRLACYCPVTSQIESCWDACEAAGLEVEWAGELIERTWGRASRGGIRPVNGPIGHTAFLLVALRLFGEPE